MTHDSDAIEDMVGLIEPALTEIEYGRSEAELRELQTLLRSLLSDFIRKIERHPGLEAASADLYAAASALVRDAGESSVPGRRRLRLFREARLRFRERLPGARPSRQAATGGWRHDELLVA